METYDVSVIVEMVDAETPQSAALDALTTIRRNIAYGQPVELVVMHIDQSTGQRIEEGVTVDTREL